VKGFLIVALGAAAGGAMRHGVNLAAARLLGVAFPWGTLLVNLLGCLAMGLLAGWFAFRGEATQSWNLLLTTGVLGGFTTFSAFSLDVALLWERGAVGETLAYAGVSVAGSVAALFAGLALMRLVTA